MVHSVGFVGYLTRRGYLSPRLITPDTGPKLFVYELFQTRPAAVFANRPVRNQIRNLERDIGNRKIGRISGQLYFLLDVFHTHQTGIKRKISFPPSLSPIFGALRIGMCIAFVHRAFTLHQASENKCA